MRAALVAFCGLLAAASASERATLYSRSIVPEGWTVGDRASASAPLKFTVAMKQQNLDKLDAKFWDVSDPNSLTYGQYLSSEEVMAMTASSPATVAAVTSFLDGVECQNMGDALICESTAGVLETLFQTKFFVMTHTSGKKIVRHMGAMSIPAALREHVDMITGLGAFPVPKHISAVRGGVPSTDGYGLLIVPETFQKLYQIGANKGSAASKQAVGEFQNADFGEGYDPTNLDQFKTNTGLSFPNPIQVNPIGPEGDEGDLDIQYIGAVGLGNTNYFWTVQEWMYEFALAFVATPASGRPAVFSISYAWAELDQCTSQIDQQECSVLGVDSQGYVTRTNTEFQKIGVLGTTLLAASGDAGAHGKTDIGCSSPLMYPNFPSASPYVTSVGGTQLTQGVVGGTAPICTSGEFAGQCAVGGVEIVCSVATGSLITSGGGFSMYAGRPKYQDAVVEKYLKNATAIPAANTFNSSGRAYPDISGLANNVYIQSGGAPVQIFGTSCSTPETGGLIGLLNAHRLAEKKPVIGFFNPLLYQIYAETPSAFNDITQGTNYCSLESCGGCTTGFAATPGWDAVTGVGTPNFSKLLAAVKAIDARREARIAAAAANVVASQ